MGKAVVKTVQAIPKVALCPEHCAPSTPSRLVPGTQAHTHDGQRQASRDRPDIRSYGPVDSGRLLGRMRPLTSTREATMHASAPGPTQASIHVNLAAIFVSSELSRSAWLVTSLSPGGGEKMSKHSVRGGDVAGLLDQLARLPDKAQARTGETFPIIVVQEAGLDGFRLHRVPEREGIESHVVDAASVLTS